MKKAILGSLLGIALAFMPLAVTAAPEAYTLTVDGLACPFCAYGLEKHINALEGIESIEIDIDEGTILVTMAEGAEIDEADLRQAVNDAGFTLRKVQQGRIASGEIEKGDG
ncbi:MAG: heavy-metal-associated domain-containing protein [SAR324 cluster bacterium]|nr:heavy-metal-associated domain-containing protein [SAR324 cluster bacterium]